MRNTGDQGGRRAVPWMAALAGFVAGAALQLQQAALSPWPVYGLFLLAGMAACALAAMKSGAIRAWPTLLAAAGVALGLGWCGLRALVFMGAALAPGLEGRDISVTGVVAAMPQRNESGLRWRFEVESARLDGAEVRLPPQVYLGWYGAPAGSGDAMVLRQPEDLRAGERWLMTLRLKAPHGGSNPHGFDFELWLWEQGLQATGYVRAGPRDEAPRRIGDTWRHPVELARQAVRDAVYARVADRRMAGIVAALVVGDQNAIDRADWDVFRATGVAHLMSISGLHITMFAWLATGLVGALWRRSARLCLAFPAPSAALLGGILLATLYALFSGWGVPSQRTVWMLTTVGLLRLSGRRWPWPQVWLLAMAVVVAADPWALLQAGFWLSFVAVGVLFATDGGMPRAAAARSAAARAAGGLGAMVREQWVVTLALTPLTLLLFQQASLVGLLANALAIPWVTLVVTPLALLGVALAPLWDIAAWAAQALDAYLRLLARMPLATVSVAAPALWASAAGVLGGLLLAMRLPWTLRALGLPLMLPVLLWQAPRPAAGEFELLAADIGQGNAVIVRTAAHTLVYDAGPRFSRESDAGHRVLVPLLRALGEQVDTVMLSHRDSDHTGGAAAVLAMQPQAALLSSIEDAHELQALRRSQRCVAGQRWDWDGVVFEVLHPAAADYGTPAKPNALSCVLRIANGARTALLAGDIEQPQEARLVAAGVPLRADLLLVPHHGSRTSSSEAFLQAVRPDLALVQAGYRNRFGHPAEAVMARYAQQGIRVRDTVHCGAAHWSSAWPHELRCQRDAALRYWHHRAP
jgi:competence protein ComEC